MAETAHFSTKKFQMSDHYFNPNMDVLLIYLAI